MLSQTDPKPPRQDTTAAAWEIRHVDICRGIAELSPLSGERGIYLVLWYQHIPLAHLEISVHQLPLTVHQLLPEIATAIAPAIGSYLFQQGFQDPLPGMRYDGEFHKPPDFSAIQAVESPLAQLQKYCDHKTFSQTDETVSIVVCTRDRPEYLARCLRSLQSLHPSPHEILIVDNAPSSTATRELVSQFPNMRYILESRGGLSIARNTGLRAATGSLIAFTDDDVEVYPNWLDGLYTAFNQPNVMAATGLIIPARLETEAEMVFQQGSTGFGWGYRALTFDRHFFFSMKSVGVPVWRIGAGANMAFRRQIFAEVGEFDERLGAGASGCSEDSELWYRILAAGWNCRYEPTAVVAHYHRADYKSLNQQMYAYMKGHMTALWIQAFKHRHWGNVRRILIALPRYYFRRFAQAVLHKFKGRHRTTMAEIRGCLVGSLGVFGLQIKPEPRATVVKVNEKE